MSSEKKFGPDAGDVRLMLDIGFACLLVDGGPDTTPIFRGLVESNCAPNAGRLGLSLAAIREGDTGKSERMLMGLIDEKSSVRRHALAFLVLCKRLRGDNVGAARVARDLEGSGDSSERLAQALL